MDVAGRWEVEEEEAEAEEEEEEEEEAEAEEVETTRQEKVRPHESQKIKPSAVQFLMFFGLVGA